MMKAVAAETAAAQRCDDAIWAGGQAESATAAAAGCCTSSVPWGRHSRTDIRARERLLQPNAISEGTRTDTYTAAGRNKRQLAKLAADAIEEARRRRAQAALAASAIEDERGAGG